MKSHLKLIMTAGLLLGVMIPVFAQENTALDAGWSIAGPFAQMNNAGTKPSRPPPANTIKL